MKSWTAAVGLAGLCLLTDVGRVVAADDAILFRVFLKDGTSLVSYGEYRTSAIAWCSRCRPRQRRIHRYNWSIFLTTRVDWDRTNRYTDSARGNRYVATQAETDYAELSGVLDQSLERTSGNVTDPAKRLSLVENARRTLAEWPQNHFNYRQADVQQMVSMLDEAIADLKAAAGGERFNLSFVSLSSSVLASEPLLHRRPRQKPFSRCSPRRGSAIRRPIARRC